MKYAKVKENPELIRDMSSKAVLNTNRTALQAYKKKREKQQEIQSAVDDINNLKQDVNELKTLMQRLLDKIG
jgi:protein subunit release factor A